MRCDEGHEPGQLRSPPTWQYKECNYPPPGLQAWPGIDTAAFQAGLDRLAHSRAVVDGQVIHLVHEPGRGPAPLPLLLLTHGWPGSFCEYLDIMPLLTDPPGRTAAIGVTRSRWWCRR